LGIGISAQELGDMALPKLAQGSDTLDNIRDLVPD
jgi:hypothetical protein